MKKTLSILFIFAILFMNTTVYGQMVQEVFQQPDPIMMSDFNTYRISAPEAEGKNFKQTSGLELNGPYYDTPVEKASAGFVNTTTSWADIPAKIAEVSERDNLFLGVTMGFGEGLVSGVARGASGIIDMATFGVPPYDEPLMEPEYKVANPDEGFKIDLLKW